MLHTARRPATAATAAVLVALMAGVAAPAAVGAQEACKIDYNKPSEVKNLYLAIDFKKDKKSIGDALRALTTKWDKVQTLPAAHLLVGRALMWYASQPDAPTTARRGDLGFATNPDQAIDLVAEMDRESAEVDRLLPACR